MSKLNNILIALVGKSGSGKTTIANKLHDVCGYSVLKSYTTRAPRHLGDDDHVFVSDEEFDKLTDIVAFTEFNGYRYCATKEQVDEADIYVIDPYGLKQLRTLYKGKKKIVPIYIDVPMEICLERMRARGDNEDKCWDRLRHDEKVFRQFKDDIEDDIDCNVVSGIPADAWLDVYHVICIANNG